MGVVTTVACAAAGGFMLNVMNLWEDSKKNKADRMAKDALYWLFFVLWPIIGGGLAYLYLLDGSTFRPLLAFTFGLSAPVTLKTLMATAVQPPNSR